MFIHEHVGNVLPFYVNVILFIFLLHMHLCILCTYYV